MRIAIVGAGFSGLSLAWHLIKSTQCTVVLYDAKGIGGGASGIAAGLLHPYVGEEGKRSLLASEGIASTKGLIAVSEEALGEKVAEQNGVLRHVLSDDLRALFLSHGQKYGDVKLEGKDCFLITSGITVDCPRYLEGLWRALQKKGVELILQEVTDVASLKGFDHVVIATGAGIRTFAELKHLRYSVLKGQVLLCQAPESVSLPQLSSICKGYIALASEKRMCSIGSTYERGVENDHPDVEGAKKTLYPKIALFFPEVEKLEIKECRAAMRVISKGHYFPIGAKIKQGLWALTGMGSRGLLYHALLGRILAEAILTGDESALSFLSNKGHTS